MKYIPNDPPNQLTLVIISAIGYATKLRLLPKAIAYINVDTNGSIFFTTLNFIESISTL